MSITAQSGALAGADGPCTPGAFLREPAAAFARLSRPTRSVASRSRSALVGVVASTKMGVSFAFESAHERDAMHLLDALEDVAAFRPQVLRVAYASDGGRRVAFPDLLVLLRTATVEAWEVKAAAALTPVVRSRLRGVAEALAGHGVRYRVRTEGWIRREPVLSNARLLRSYSREALPALVASQVRAAFDAVAPSARTLGELGAATGLTRPTLLAAALRGVFAVDLSSPDLGDRCAVRAAKAGATSGGFVPADATEGARASVSPASAWAGWGAIALRS